MPDGVRLAKKALMYASLPFRFSSRFDRKWIKPPVELGVNRQVNCHTNGTSDGAFRMGDTGSRTLFLV
jgi:hypothetical protein